ncbi:MAG: type I methionyl aminopeptidase [Victivallaceae bacterium]
MVSRPKAIIHTPEEIIRIRRAAQATALVRDRLAAIAVPGMSTLEFDRIAASLIAETGGKSAFLGYHGYPGNICISLNDEVVHGIARADRIMAADDLVSIDLGIELDGAIGDTAITFGLGAPLSPRDQLLLDTTSRALTAGISRAIAGNYIRDISAAIESVARKNNIAIVRDFVGHGCGIKLHEPPEIPNYVTPNRGVRLEPGMVLAIEPMFNLGTYRVTIDPDDKWTVRTQDGKRSAHFEHMVLVTDNEPEILTWPKTM